MTKRKFANKRDWISIVGMLFVIFGILSILLSLVGARFTFLSWMDYWGPLAGFIIRLVITVGGFVILFLSRTSMGNRSEL